MKLAYEEFGSDTQPPLIILHGFFASSRNWRFIARQLADQFHVFVPDLRNHGMSAHHAEMNYAVMADDLAEFIRSTGLQQASIMGHSMGGKVAMWFALNHPEKVADLIIVDIAPVSYTHSFAAMITALKSLPLEQINNRKQAEEWLAEDIPELGFRQFLLQNLMLEEQHYHWRIDLDVFAETAGNITAFPDAANLPVYAEQCLFVIGEVSNHVTDEHRPAIRHLFPQSTIKVLSQAGHWLHVQQPEQFLAVLNAYWAEKN